MQSFVMTTFIIIMAFSLINMIVSFTLYATSKRSLYLRTGLFWSSLIVNFFIQSQAQGSEPLIVLGFGFSIIPLNFLAYVSLFFCGASYPKKILIPISITSLVLTVMIMDLSIPFTLKALPFSVASAAPLAYTVYMYYKNRKKMLTKMMLVQGIILFLFCIHCFNFAFFRMVPEAQFWGWPVAYGLYQALAMLIPAMTLEFYHNEEQGRLKLEVERRTQEIQALAKENQMLLNIMMHDLANPIQLIRGFANKLTPNTISPELYNSHERFKRGLESMFETLKSVREFQVAKLGKVVPTLKMIRIVDPLKQCLLLYEDRIAEKNINVIVDYNDSQDIYIQADISWIKNQIFANIISNAIKFSPIGGDVKISFLRDIDSIKIRFRDYGSGIPKDIKENIFSPYKATTKLGTSGEKGTGLGMPIVKEYIERLNGKIQILELKEPEKGTCFELEFKVYDHFERLPA